MLHSLSSRCIPSPSTLSFRLSSARRQCLQLVCGWGVWGGASVAFFYMLLLLLAAPVPSCLRLNALPLPTNLFAFSPPLRLTHLQRSSSVGLFSFTLFYCPIDLRLLGVCPCQWGRGWEGGRSFADVCRSRLRFLFLASHNGPMLWRARRCVAHILVTQTQCVEAYTVTPKHTSSFRSFFYFLFKRRFLALEYKCTLKAARGGGGATRTVMEGGGLMCVCV